MNKYVVNFWFASQAFDHVLIFTCVVMALDHDAVFKTYKNDPNCLEFLSKNTNNFYVETYKVINE